MRYIDSVKIGDSIQDEIEVLHKIFYKEDSGYGIYLVKNDLGDVFTIKGDFFSALEIGQSFKVDGVVIVYNGERELKTSVISPIKPKNKFAIITYLQTIPGLKKRAEKIYDEFKEQSITLLIESPEVVANAIKGISLKQALKWQQELLSKEASRATLTTLFRYGLKTKQAKKLFDQYGDSIIERIEENPYFLAEEVKGYGFLSCDKIAREIGYDEDSFYRIKEGFFHTLKTAALDGHCFLPKEELINKAYELLSINATYQEMIKLKRLYAGETSFVYNYAPSKTIKINYSELLTSIDHYIKAGRSKKNDYLLKYFSPKLERLEEVLLSIIESNHLIEVNGMIYLKKYYLAELRVAQKLLELIKEEETSKWNVHSKLTRYCKVNKVELEDKQKLAIESFSATIGGVYILDGSAGTGKTFVLNLITKMFEKFIYDTQKREAIILQMAPTGKASKVMMKATNRESLTIHRGLSYQPKTKDFAFNEENPLEADLLVIDETSMLDILLMDHLLRAISPKTKVIFIGDTKQLPSVGAGNVLKDMINSSVIKQVTLDVIKRQDKQSGIVLSAHDVIKGRMIGNHPETDDAYFVKKSTPESIQKGIIDSIHRIQKKKGFKLDDIQVLCPQKAGKIGVEYLNFLLQQTFNPLTTGEEVLNKKIFITNNGKTETISLNFRVGDKVIHTKNNYDAIWYTEKNGVLIETSITGITNGECGVIYDITKISDGQYNITVKYDDFFIIYENDFSEIDHAYALTIHKSQGSQWKVVFLPISMSHYMMLENNILYTGLTRASDFVAVIGESDAVWQAIKTQRATKRYTRLAELLSLAA